MKTYSEAKKLYIKDHLSKGLTQPERRINALNAIEKLISLKDSSLLHGSNLFMDYKRKEDFIDQYIKWKSKNLSGAEKSVIIGLYKFSK